MAKKELPAKGKSRSKRSRYDRLVIAGIIIALIAIVLTLWGPLRKLKISEEKRPAQAKRLEPAGKKQPDRSGKKQEKKETAERQSGREAKENRKHEASEKRSLVAIVIDDLGQDVKTAREIAALPCKITFAVMPGLPQSRRVAELARQNNREVLVHLPMEYRNRNGKPAPGMLRSDMTPMDFLKTLTDDMASVPGAIGVNNHEGSSLTENKEAMKFLMAELKARELIFLDSLTSPKSLAYATAKEFGLKATKRDVFLDNDSDDEGAIRKQLEELVRVAKEHGRAIGIGHPHAATINEIRNWLATASEQGVDIVPLSRVIN